MIRGHRELGTVWTEIGDERCRDGRWIPCAESATGFVDAAIRQPLREGHFQGTPHPPEKLKNEPRKLFRINKKR